MASPNNITSMQAQSVGWVNAVAQGQRVQSTNTPRLDDTSVPIADIAPQQHMGDSVDVFGIPPSANPEESQYQTAGLEEQSNMLLGPFGTTNDFDMIMDLGFDNSVLPAGFNLDNSFNL